MVPVEVVHQYAAVDRNDISLLKRVAVGNAVHHLLVARHAEGIWESIHAQKTRNSAMVSNELLGKLVQTERGYTRLNFKAEHAQSARHELCGLANKGNFVGGL